MSHKVSVAVIETDVGEEFFVTFSHNQSATLSESTFGFERRMFIKQKATSVQIFEDTPSLTHFQASKFRNYKYIETEGILDFHFLCGLERLMLIRDNNIFRLIAWGCNAIDRYKLYTRSWEQFCNSVSRITEGKLKPTEKLWSGGYVVNVVGPDIQLTQTPLTDDFENRVLGLIRNQFDGVLKSGVYGIAESDVYAAQANIENTIHMLHNAARRFTPLNNDFESQLGKEVGISDFQI